MFHYYAPSSRSNGYTSYIPRRFSLPVTSLAIDGAPPPVYPLEGLAYPSSSLSCPPPRIDAETRYRRALYEAEVAKQEYQAHLSSERLRLPAAILQRATAEAAPRERELTLFAQIERARALQEQDVLAQRQRGLQSRTVFDLAHRGGDTPMYTVYVDADRGSLAQGDPARLQPGNETLTMGNLPGVLLGVQPERQLVTPAQMLTAPTHPLPGNETLTMGGLSGVLGGVYPGRQRATPAQRLTIHTRPQPISNLLGLFPGVRPEPQRDSIFPLSTPLTSQVHSSSAPHTQPQRSEQNANVNLSNILGFFHSIPSQARGAPGGEQPTHEQTLSSQPEALFPARDAADVKKAHASKGSQSGASSYEVVGTAWDGMATLLRDVTSPLTPMSTINGIRAQFCAFQSWFKFPPTLDFDNSELALTPNNEPVRIYEQALNRLLERLDAIDSDGNEEVRDARRKLVREVENALKEVELKVVREQARQASVREAINRIAGGVETEDVKASGTQTVPPAVTEATKATQSNVAPPAPSVFIFTGYQSGAPAAIPSGEVVAEQVSATDAALANGNADKEVVPASEDVSLSIGTLTITPAPVTAVDPVPCFSSKPASTSTPGAADELRPEFSQSSTNSGVSHDDDAVIIVVDNSGEGGSVRSVDGE